MTIVRRSVYDKKPQRYAKTTEQHLTVRSGKSDAAVTNNNRLRSRFCTVEANYCRYEASRGLSATAKLLARHSADVSEQVSRPWSNIILQN